MHNLRTIFLGKRSFFILIIFGLFVINAIWLIPTLRNTRVSASVFALTVAERIQSEINGSFENALNNAISVSGEVADEPERTTIIFKNLLRYHSIFTSISLVDRSGKELLHIDSSGLFPPEKLIDQSRNTSFYLALQERTIFTSPIILLNGETHITLFVPVPKKGEFIDKVIIAELNVENLLSIIRSPHIGQGHAYVVDRDGVEILNPNVAKILQHHNLSSRPIVKKVLVNGVVADGLAQDDQYVDENGEDTFTVGMPIPIVKWGVFVEQPRLQALAGERQAVILAIITSILAIIIFLVIAFSISKLRKLTVLLGKANEDLKQLDQAKSEFMSIASHQLRTPLTIIKGYISLALEGTLGVISKQAKESFGKAAFSTEQLIKLVNELLNLSRMESGKMTYVFAINNLSMIIKEVVEELRPQAEQKKIKLIVEPKKNLEQFIFDRDKIREVIINLTHNAVKYTQKGDIIIHQEIVSHDNKQYVRISVKDNGMGVSYEDISKLFTKFARSAEAKAVDVNGIGLGLFFVKKVVEDHGGTCWVQSQGLGKGSVFTIQIPFRQHA